MSNRKQPTVAIGHRYDSRYLRNGIVRVEGFDVEYPAIPSRDDGTQRMAAPGEPYMAPAPIFPAMAKDPPYDLGEQAFSTYVQAVDRGMDVTAIPVFPSRFYPHFQVCARADSDIWEPKDLEGKRFAVGSFAINFAVWLRGMFEEQYGVATDRITWVTQTDEYYAAPATERFAIERAPAGKSVWALLEAGLVDALAFPWATTRAKERGLRLLLSDPYAEIAAFWRINPVFPINTVVMLPKRTLQEHSDLPAAVFRAYQRALSIYRDEVRQRVVADDEYGGTSLSAMGEMTGEMLPDYGIAPSRRNIETMVRYCHEQGLISNALAPEELFLDLW